MNSASVHVRYLGELIPGDIGGERLGEVEVLDPAVGAAHSLAVVGKEVEPLVRVDHQLGAVGALHNKTQGLSQLLSHIGKTYIVLSEIVNTRS